jgi:hypothetical protein
VGMFGTLQPARPQPVEAWVTSTLYSFWCALGVAGVFIGFLKHGASQYFCLFSYSATFILALCFLVASQNHPITHRKLAAHCWQS